MLGPAQNGVTMTSASEALRDLHHQRSQDRTVVGLWHAGLTDEERVRFQEFVDAFRANPSYSLPLLREALFDDEILGVDGARFPDVTGESLSKFLRRMSDPDSN